MTEIKIGDRVEFNHGQGKLRGVVVELRQKGEATQAVICVTAGTASDTARGREYVRNVHFCRLVAA